jgi:hypothetical protein
MPGLIQAMLADYGMMKHKPRWAILRKKIGVSSFLMKRLYS